MEDVFKTLSKPLPEFELRPGKTALLLIDFQRLVNPEGLLSEALNAGLPEVAVKAALGEYKQRINKAVHNGGKILKAFRKKGYDIVHIKMGAQTSIPRHT